MGSFKLNEKPLPVILKISPNGSTKGTSTHDVKIRPKEVSVLNRVFRHIDTQNTSRAFGVGRANLSVVFCLRAARLRLVPEGEHRGSALWSAEVVLAEQKFDGRFPPAWDIGW